MICGIVGRRGGWVRVPRAIFCGVVFGVWLEYMVEETGLGVLKRFGLLREMGCVVGGLGGTGGGTRGIGGGLGRIGGGSWLVEFGGERTSHAREEAACSRSMSILLCSSGVS